MYVCFKFAVDALQKYSVYVNVSDFKMFLD